jgi:hypothetical protein
MMFKCKKYTGFLNSLKLPYTPSNKASIAAIHEAEDKKMLRLLPFVKDGRRSLTFNLASGIITMPVSGHNIV